MDHVVIPLDDDHERATTSTVAAMSAAVGATIHPAQRRVHITLVAYDGISRVTAHHAVEAAVADASGFVVHAHGYGFFCGPDGQDLSLHVPVVRSPALDVLHGAIHGALVSAGAEVAGSTDPCCWSPHITLVEAGLDPDSLGACSGWLAAAPPSILENPGEPSPHRGWGIRRRGAGIDHSALRPRPRRTGGARPGTAELGVPDYACLTIAETHTVAAW